MAISGINSAWSREQRALNLGLIERWRELSHSDVLTPSHGETSGSWSFRNVSPLFSVVPFLGMFEPVVRQGQRVLHHIWAGRTTAAASGTGQLARALGTSMHSAQTTNQGLNEMFLAQDRYHKARIEAQYKEFQAHQENVKFYTLNELNDVVTEQASQQLGMELFSNMLARSMETQSLIIRNL